MKRNLVLPVGTAHCDEAIIRSEESYRVCVSLTMYNLKPTTTRRPRPKLGFFFWRNSPHWARASSFTRLLDHTQRCTTFGRIPLDDWSARRRDLYLTTHKHSRQRETTMSPVGFELTISTGERPQTHALDRAATGTGELGCSAEENY